MTRVLRVATGLIAGVGAVCGRRARRPLVPPYRILVTAAFSSPNWIRAHLEPVQEAESCREVVLVATDETPQLDRLKVVRPSPILLRLFKPTGARLLVFVWLALTQRPDIIAGFHLLANGMLAILLARVTRCRSVYFCGGGVTEFLGGGVYGENRVFGRLAAPDLVIESRLVACVNQADLIVTMGNGAAEFLRSRDVTARIDVRPGGHRFALQSSSTGVQWDFVLVGRLVAVKRVDLFLEAVHLVAESSGRPVTAVIVGDGPLRSTLEGQALRLRLGTAVTFVGYQRNVAEWLRRSRVVVLTSESEGVPLALMEAFAAGLPAVAADVGDVRDLVQDDFNGYLVRSREPAAFAVKMGALLADGGDYQRLAQGAARTAARHDVTTVSAEWNRVLAELAGPDDRDTC